MLTTAIKIKTIRIVISLINMKWQKVELKYNFVAMKTVILLKLDRFEFFTIFFIHNIPNASRIFIKIFII